MATVYTVPDLLQLTMSMFIHPDAWVGVSTPGRMAPQRAAQRAFCPKCITTDVVVTAKLKAALREPRASLYLFPTYDELCGVRYDHAGPKCEQCKGPKS